MKNKEKNYSFEEFVEKEINKEMLQGFIASFIIALFIMLLIIIGIVTNKNTNIFEIKETEYNKVYELKDKSWFIVDRENNNYIFQAVDLGDWDYQLSNETDLKKIIETYYINKYNVNEDRAITEVEKIFNNIK